MFDDNQAAPGWNTRFSCANDAVAYRNHRGVLLAKGHIVASVMGIAEWRVPRSDESAETLAAGIKVVSDWRQQCLGDWYVLRGRAAGKGGFFPVKTFFESWVTEGAA